MPQRFLKPGIVTSKKWDGLSWVAQSFYIRVLTLVDDFGRHEADPVLLKNQCFPLREDIRASQVHDLCRELARAQLAIFYKADGKDYVQLTNWTERSRSNRSWYPAPGSEILYDSSPQDSAAERRIPQPPSLSPSPKPSPQPEPKPEPEPSLMRPSPSVREHYRGNGFAERPSLREALDEAQRIGLAPWKAEDWWNEMEGCGWKDFHNRDVEKWRPMLARVRTKWEADGRPMQPPVSHRNGKSDERRMTPLDIRTIIQAKEAEANAIKQKHSSETAMEVAWDNQSKRSDWVKLRREIRELNNRLAQMA